MTEPMGWPKTVHIAPQRADLLIDIIDFPDSWWTDPVPAYIDRSASVERFAHALLRWIVEAWPSAEVRYTTYAAASNRAEAGVDVRVLDLAGGCCTEDAIRRRIEEFHRALRQSPEQWVVVRGRAESG